MDAFPITLSTPAGAGDARTLTLGPVRLFFSYATLVACEAPGFQVRTSERFSATTARHLRALGCDSFAPLDPELFAVGVRAALARSFVGTGLVG